MKKEAIKTAFIYAIFGILWIVLSDRFLLLMKSDATFLSTIQTYKGITFVILTTLLIFFLVNREINRKNKVISVLNLKNSWHNKLISNIPDIDVFLIDTDKNVVLAQGNTVPKNDARYDLKNINDNYYNQIIPHLDKVFDGKKVVSEWKVKDCWYELRGEGILDEKNQISSALLVIIDITHQKQIQMDIEHSRLKAEENDKLKSAFLANMSHEIRTPLNGILGFSNLICADDLTLENKQRFAGIINNSGNQLLRMIDDILDISKLETGQLQIFESETDILKVINHVSDLLLNRLNSKNKSVKIKLNTSTLKSKNIVCDKGRLTQILTNLTNNAEKFTYEGYIAINCIEKSDFLLFEVEDTGLGMEQEALDKVFNRFIQADNSIQSKHGGSGLGLAICHELLQVMGGKIWVESQKDKGSKFSFTLPKKSDKPAAINTQTTIHSN